eukprot:GILJ01030458.1.p1 GENE.GILJ01030458.1~~GILJ01030458.1.p1  ORF type:complete len:208 (+),score=20.31 GILJ01030458.1:52-624(+)
MGDSPSNDIPFSFKQVEAFNLFKNIDDGGSGIINIWNLVDMFKSQCPTHIEGEELATSFRLFLSSGNFISLPLQFVETFGFHDDFLWYFGCSNRTHGTSLDQQMHEQWQYYFGPDYEPELLDSFLQIDNEEEFVSWLKRFAPLRSNKKTHSLFSDHIRPYPLNSGYRQRITDGEKVGNHTRTIIAWVTTR